MSPPSGALRRLRSEGPVWALIAAMIAMAALLYLLLIRHQASPAGELHVPWWVVALGFAAAVVFVGHVDIRHSAPSPSLAEPPLVTGLFPARPSVLMLGATHGPGLVLLANR